MPALGVLSAAGLLGGLTVLAPLANRPAEAPTGPAPPDRASAPRAVAAAPRTAGPTTSGSTTSGPVAPGLPAARVERADASPKVTGPARPAARWRWPLLVTPRVVRGFEPPPQRWLPGHRGVDLAAVPGDTVVAAGAGIVTFAGPLAGRGVVTVTHGELRTTYEPVTATVEVGDVVAAGDPIGVIASGASHCGGYPSCLHWGLLQGAVYLDPLLLLGVSHPILLPIPH